VSLQTAPVTVPADRSAAGLGRLEELYVRHAPEALRVAYLMTGDRDSAQDLVQEAFVRVVGRWRHLRDPGAFPAYLRRTVVNLARNQFRRGGIERRHLARAAGRSHASQAPSDAGTRDELRRALLGLPLRQRAAIVLRFYEDLSEAETAHVLGCAPGTVKSLVSRGMHTLRTTLQENPDD
jgi:RNA polymerase sigma-70 factor (sigma-E family)